MLTDLSGYNLSIYNKGEITHKSFGYREVRPKQKKCTLDTYYDIASLTKNYVATLIFILEDEGKLSIEDKVSSIDNNFENIKNIKIKDLLCHNQGIWTKGYIGDATSKEEYLKILYSSYVKTTKPTYVDIDYIILGHLIEKICNKDLSEVMREKIIDKLGLTQTTYNPPKNVASTNFENQVDANIAPGELHDRKARNLKKLGITTGHASLFATSNDVLKFLLSFFNNSLLKPSTINSMRKHHNINKLNKVKHWNCITYNYMGAKYYNDIERMNDIPAHGNLITFSGYTGPRYLVDFDNKIIIVLMCNIVHNSTLDRKGRFNLTKNIVLDIYNDLIKKN